MAAIPCRTGMTGASRHRRLHQQARFRRGQHSLQEIVDKFAGESLVGERPVEHLVGDEDGGGALSPVVGIWPGGRVPARGGPLSGVGRPDRHRRDPEPDRRSEESHGDPGGRRRSRQHEAGPADEAGEGEASMTEDERRRDAVRARLPVAQSAARDPAAEHIQPEQFGDQPADQAGQTGADHRVACHHLGPSCSTRIIAAIAGAHKMTRTANPAGSDFRWHERSGGG